MGQQSRRLGVHAGVARLQRRRRHPDGGLRLDGTGNLNSKGCSSCSGIQFGGQLFSGVEPYFYDFNGGTTNGAQKAGPIPLGNECGIFGVPPPAAPKV